MESRSILYIIGLVLVIFFILSGLDDVIWDLSSLFIRKNSKDLQLNMEDLDALPPKMIAVMLAAWDEESVLEEVIDNVIQSQMYPQSMYHIFLGVYPNDLPTVRIAKKLEKKYPNVHCVINYKEGPTSKAQNLNYVIKQIKAFEKENNYEFASFTIHDSEDVVHPYELKVTNYLIEKYPALQFPVFPLIRKPTIRNYFKDITTNTYVDEFAENHYITMRNRHESGAFVPSAGTGFSLSREVIELLGEDVLPEKSLTEDYRLSLTLYEQGIQMYYVLERIKRVNWESEVVWDYIATRSIFPNTFKAAVKQKTRWTLGITMQSYRFRDLFKSEMPFVGKYSLYRDQKAKVSNMLAGIGYPVVIYFLISLFTPLEAIYPYFSVSWYLSLVVTFMMLERQIVRGIALYNVYGFRSSFFGVLFPPFLPFRIIWGNIINFTSTFRAYIQYFQKTKEEKQATENTDLTILDEKELVDKAEIISALPDEEKKFNWSKTEHDFLDKEVLERFHRKLGDILIVKGFIDVYDLKKSLKNKSYTDKLGEFLERQEMITNTQLVESLAALENKEYLDQNSLKYYNFIELAEKYENLKLKERLILPLYEKEERLVIAYSNLSPMNLEQQLKKELGKDIYLVLAPCDTLEDGFNLIKENAKSLAQQNKVFDIESECEAQQVIISRNYAGKLDQSEEDVLEYMGVVTK